MTDRHETPGCTRVRAAVFVQSWGPFLARQMLVTALTMTAAGLARAQSGPGTRPEAAAPSFTVTRAPAAIRIDGRLDDAGWEGAPEIPLDWEWTPGDNTRPPVRTVCRLSYDADHLFIGCLANDPEPQSIRAHLIDRDDTARLVLDDHLLVLIDPFNDRRRAFQFRVNPLGTQADAMLSTAEGFEDFSWDAIWSSAGRLTSTGYEVELAIPFRSLRFPRGGSPQTWGFLFERSWPRTVRHRIQSAPRDRSNQCILCEANRVSGFQGVAPGRNVELAPTATASRTDRRLTLASPALDAGDVDRQVGIDLRWGITPNLSLNGTVNPDFSQVEADVAQLDVNTRFALFFPEKRPFFLEGADFFSTPLQAVFTRTIADPDAGIKVTGKVGQSSRSAIGGFAARDAVTNLLFPSNQGSSAASLQQDAQTVVGRFRQDLGQASYVGTLYTGRFGAGYANQVGGVDVFHQLSRSTSVRAQLLASRTAYPDSIATRYAQPGGGAGFGGSGLSAELRHQTARWWARAEYQDLSPEFRSDAGFVPRVDTRMVTTEGARQFFRREGWFTFLAVGGAFSQTYDHRGALTDRSLAGFVRYQGPAQSFLQVNLVAARQRFASNVFDLETVQLRGELKPAGWLSLRLAAEGGDAIDVFNIRKGRQVVLQPGAQVSVGRGLSLDLSHAYQQLRRDGGRVFSANLFQSKVIYQFSVRTMARAIVQYRDVRRDPSRFTAPDVPPEDRTLFGQFLFSYKVNPQTLLFLGYSHNAVGTDRLDLTQTARTFFAKIGYAWRP